MNPFSKAFQTRRGNKYGAVKVKDGGNTYDSRGEHEMHQTLRLMERAGLIKDIIHHPPAVALTRFVNYRPDFKFYDIKRETFVYVEFKGVIGERYRVIKNLWREFGQVPLQEWHKKGTKLFMTDEIFGGK